MPNRPSSINEDATDKLPQIECNVLLDEFPTVMETRKAVQLPSGKLFQDYFSSCETGQSVGWAKTGEPREKPPDTPASRSWLVSHVARAGLEPTPVTAVIVLVKFR